jgi:Double-GTPase 2
MCLVYLILLIPYLLYLSFVLPLVAFLAFMAYTIVIPGCYVVGLFRVLALRPPSLPPPRWFPRRPADGEPAELSYFYGPAFAEVEHVATVAYGIGRETVTWGTRQANRAFKDGYQVTTAVRMITVPLAIGGVVGMFAGAVFGAVLFAGVALIHVAVAAIVFGVMRVSGLVLRLTDSGMLRVKNIKMTCPHCYERVSYPAYQCPDDHCDNVHHDIRPSKYGIIRRRCLCGTQLPTLLLLGSARLRAYCPYPHCGRPLEHRPGEAREVVLPFFGAAGAGKTRLMYGIVTLLKSAKGLHAEFADSATEVELAEIKPLLAPGRKPVKTPRTPPHGQTLRLRSGNRTRLLQLYDSAGENFYQTETTEALGYLDKARTYVLVLDPLSIDHLWRSLSPERQAELAQARSDAPSSLAYETTTQEIEAKGQRLKKARLAVVFSRSDLLEDPSEQQVDVWAEQTLGLGNLVRSVRKQFGEVGFFRTASVLTSQDELHPSLARLTRWLLNDDGFVLPEHLNGKSL